MYNYSHFASYLRATSAEVLLDVGANSGQFASDIFALGYTGRIVSFEPLTEAHAQLSRRAKENARWEVAPRSAIGARPGTAEIKIAGNSYSSSIRPMLDAHISAAPQSKYIGSETTPVRTLAEVLQEKYSDRIPSFALKIDTQGFEREVLDGLGFAIEKCVAILIELPLVPLYEGAEDLPTLVGRISGMGFRCAGMSPGHCSPKAGDDIEVDALFVRDAAIKVPFQFKVFTSIPPRVDVAEQRRVLDSWRVNGFTPVSVNSAAEIERVAALRLDVEIEQVGTPGKPLISEILSVARKDNVGVVGIVNADCRMIRYPRLAQNLAACLPGRLLYAQRMETVGGSPIFQEFCYGFDGFFFDLALVDGINDRTFRMGECWWDYWFPLRMAANGARIAKMSQPLLLHEKHRTNWSSSDWQKYADLFWQDLKNWSDNIELPHQVRARLDLPMLGEASGLIALELYRWLRDRPRPEKLNLLPAEYAELESLLCIENLISEETPIVPRVTRVQALKAVKYLLSNPILLKRRVKTAISVLRNHGPGEVMRQISRITRD